MAHFFLLLNNIPLSGYTTVHLSIDFLIDNKHLKIFLGFCTLSPLFPHFLAFLYKPSSHVSNICLTVTFLQLTLTPQPLHCASDHHSHPWNCSTMSLVTSHCPAQRTLFGYRIHQFQITTPFLSQSTSYSWLPWFYSLLVFLTPWILLLHLLCNHLLVYLAY